MAKLHTTLQATVNEHQKKITELFEERARCQETCNSTILDLKESIASIDQERQKLQDELLQARKITPPQIPDNEELISLKKELEEAKRTTCAQKEDQIQRMQTMVTRFNAGETLVSFFWAEPTLVLIWNSVRT